MYLPDIPRYREFPDSHNSGPTFNECAAIGLYVRSDLSREQYLARVMLKFIFRVQRCTIKNVIFHVFISAQFFLISLLYSRHICRIFPVSISMRLLTYRDIYDGAIADFIWIPRNLYESRYQVQTQYSSNAFAWLISEEHAVGNIALD